MFSRSWDCYLKADHKNKQSTHTLLDLTELNNSSEAAFVSTASPITILPGKQVGIQKELKLTCDCTRAGILWKRQVSA